MNQSAYVTPKTRDEFVARMGEAWVSQVESFTNETMQGMWRYRAYMKARDVLRQVQKRSPDHLNEELLYHPDFQALVLFHVENLPKQVLDTQGTFTSPQIWQQEHELMMAARQEDTGFAVDDDLLFETLGEALSVMPEGRWKGWDEKASLKSNVDRLRASGVNIKGVSQEPWPPAWSGVENQDWMSLETLEQALEQGILPDTENTVWLVDGDTSLDRRWSFLQEQWAQTNPALRTAVMSGPSWEQSMAVVGLGKDTRRVSILEGMAGTGKSKTTQLLKALYERQGMEVIGTALTWSAAVELGKSSNIRQTQSLRKLLNKLDEFRKKGDSYFYRPVVVFVDEAGLVSSKDMHELLMHAQASRGRMKIVLLGDSQQLSPVDAGMPLEMLAEQLGSMKLETIRRQANPDHREAVSLLSEKKGFQAIQKWLPYEPFRFAADAESRRHLVVQDYLSYTEAFPERETLVLAADNQEVRQINQLIRSAYRRVGRLGREEIEVTVTDGRERWQESFAVGDKVMCRGNQLDLPTWEQNEQGKWLPGEPGVSNRMTGMVIALSQSEFPKGSFNITVLLDGKPQRKTVINTHTYKLFEKPGLPLHHAYATSIYASQGATVDQAFILDSPMVSFREAYVAMSRHRLNAYYYIDENELHQRLDKLSGKSPSTFTQGKPASQVKVVGGRYSREEMIKSVAYHWSMNRSNMTAHLYHERWKAGALPNSFKPAIAWDPQQPLLVADAPDWKTIRTPAYGKLNVQEVLALPNPVGQTTYVKNSEAIQAKAARPTHESPIQSIVEPAMVEGPGWKKAVGLLSKVFQGIAPKPETKPSSGKSSGKSVVLKSTALDKSWRERCLELLGPGQTMPLWASAQPQMRHGFPEVEGISPEIWKATHQRWWREGPEQSVRWLSLDHKGQLRAVYDQEGRCVAGNAYPPMLLGPSNPQTVLNIYPTAAAWIQAVTKQGGPECIREGHHIWAAQDADWMWVGKSMAQRQVRLHPGPGVEGEVWAERLAKHLLENWRVKAYVAGQEPLTETTHTASTEMGSGIRRGRPKLSP